MTDTTIAFDGQSRTNGRARPYATPPHGSFATAGDVGFACFADLLSLGRTDTPLDAMLRIFGSVSDTGGLCVDLGQIATDAFRHGVSTHDLIGVCIDTAEVVHCKFGRPVDSVDWALVAVLRASHRGEFGSGNDFDAAEMLAGKATTSPAAAAFVAVVDLLAADLEPDDDNLDDLGVPVRRFVRQLYQWGVDLEPGTSEARASAGREVARFAFEEMRAQLATLVTAVEGGAK